MKLNHRNRQRHLNRIARRNGLAPIANCAAQPHRQEAIAAPVVVQEPVIVAEPANVPDRRFGELRVRKASDGKTFELVWLGADGNENAPDQGGFKLQKDAVAYGLEKYNVTAKKLIAKKVAEDAAA